MSRGLKKLLSDEPICDCKWWDGNCLLDFYPCDCEKCSYYEEGEEVE